MLGGPPNTPGCMNPDIGYRATGDGVYVGAPAVMAPAKGAVWVQVSAAATRAAPAQEAPAGEGRFRSCTQAGSRSAPGIAICLCTPQSHWRLLPLQGYTYNVTFPRAHAPVGLLEVAIHQGTNCGDLGAPLHVYPAQAATLSATAAWLSLTVPTNVTGTDIFLQITGPAGALQCHGSRGVAVLQLLVCMLPWRRCRWASPACSMHLT